MGKFIPELISIVAPTMKKKERHDFTMKIKNEAIRKQKGKCAICGEYMNRWERDFHHQDGNKSNNSHSNCQAVHTRCHRKKHAEKMSCKKHASLFHWTWRKGIIVLLIVLANVTGFDGTGIALADPIHCDREGYPSCYSVGHVNGWRQAIWDASNHPNYDPSCPAGHSENFCTGYRDGYIQNWDAYGNMNTNTIGQGQSSGVDIHGNNNKVTVNQGQTGSDSSGEAILPRCVVLCGYVNNH
jgi:hypothetical protein